MLEELLKEELRKLLMVVVVAVTRQRPRCDQRVYEEGDVSRVVAEERVSMTMNEGL